MSTAADLRPVPVQELRLLDEGRRWEVDQHLGELPSLTPVRGSLQAIHRGNVLELEGEGSTIVTLCCDRCLQHYNHPLSFRSRELLWLGEQARQSGLGPETLLVPGTSAEHTASLLDLETDELCESLDPSGSFEPEHWLFEQLSLQLPLVNRCGDDCPGPPQATSATDEPVDPRWAALRRLQDRSDP
ncbi:MAG: YceD family protein [Vulcanococcus sp.]